MLLTIPAFIEASFFSHFFSLEHVEVKNEAILNSSFPLPQLDTVPLTSNAACVDLQSISAVKFMSPVCRIEKKAALGHFRVSVEREGHR